MAKKSKSKDDPEETTSERDSSIMTRSELEALSEAEKQAFRISGGTVTEDPS